jgi:hypothetical protein
MEFPPWAAQVKAALVQVDPDAKGKSADFQIAIAPLTALAAFIGALLYFRAYLAGGMKPKTAPPRHGGDDHSNQDIITHGASLPVCPIWYTSVVESISGTPT